MNGLVPSKALIYMCTCVNREGLGKGGLARLASVIGFSTCLSAWVTEQSWGCLLLLFTLKRFMLCIQQPIGPLCSALTSNFRKQLPCFIKMLYSSFSIVLILHHCSSIVEGPSAFKCCCVPVSCPHNMHSELLSFFWYTNLLLDFSIFICNLNSWRETEVSLWLSVPSCPCMVEILIHCNRCGRSILPLYGHGIIM